MWRQREMTLKRKTLMYVAFLVPYSLLFLFLILYPHPVSGALAIFLFICCGFISVPIAAVVRMEWIRKAG